jgi:hypothetical protein
MTGENCQMSANLASDNANTANVTTESAEEMKVKYRIIEVDSSQHSVVVRYYTDILSQDDLATSFDTNNTIIRRPDGTPQRCQTDYNINIWKTNPSPTIEDIHEIAKGAAPYDWFKLKHDVLNPSVDTTLNVVSTIMNQEFTAVKPKLPYLTIDISNQNSTNTNVDTTEQEIQDLINSILGSNNSSNVASSNT